jgi:hypothetical protein
VASEAAAGKDRLHVLVEIEVLSGSGAALAPMAGGCRNQRDTGNQSPERRRTPGAMAISKVVKNIRHGEGEDRIALVSYR